MVVPIFTLGIAACCAAAARFGESVPGSPSAGVIGGASAAELIVAPLVLVMLGASFRCLISTSFAPVRIWPLAGLVVVLGGLGLVDRVDALNAQLLLVLALGVLWILGGQTQPKPEDDSPVRPDWLGLLTPLAGIGAAALIGWAILAGFGGAGLGDPETAARLALGLVSVNLLVWAIGERDLARLATGLFIAAGVGIGGANLTRIVLGAMAQPEWASGDRAQAMALELSSRPYLPGFGATLPDTMLLVIGALLVVLAGESERQGTSRRWLGAGMVLGLAGSQVLWMWVSAG